MIKPLKLNYAILSSRPGWRDPRVKRVLSFFARKGLIAETPAYDLQYRRQISLEDLLWVCAEVEPELFQLVPAALLRYPTHFDGRPPRDLRVVLEALRDGESDGPAYKGFAYEFLKEWANRLPNDRRVSRELVRRVSHRLPVTLLAEVRNRARRAGCTQTRVVAEALRRYLASP